MIYIFLPLCLALIVCMDIVLFYTNRVPVIYLYSCQLGSYHYIAAFHMHCTIHHNSQCNECFLKVSITQVELGTVIMVLVCKMYLKLDFIKLLYNKMSSKYLCPNCPTLLYVLPVNAICILFWTSEAIIKTSDYCSSTFVAAALIC